MTWSFGESVSSAQESLSQSAFLKGISTNPFIASFIITILILLIILFAFRHVSLPKNESIYSILTRTGVYIYGAVLVIMYCHHYFMKQDMNKNVYDGAGPNIASTLTVEDFPNPVVSTSQSNNDTTGLGETAVIENLPPPIGFGTNNNNIETQSNKSQKSQKLPSFV